MPLTEFQETLLGLLAENRTPDSYLGGGAALHIDPASKRYCYDLEFYHDSEERVASAFADDRASLEAAGYTLDLAVDQPGFIRVTVRRDRSATRIQWAHHSSWRFLPVVRSSTAGYVLHPVDLAIDTLLVLVGRDEARDFLDLMYAHEATLPLGALCWAAVGKDPGFTPGTLLELLRRRGSCQDEDVERLNLRETPDLPALRADWVRALGQAAHFVASRPASEVGCLYYSRSRSAFVGEIVAGETDAMPHYGCPGGALPSNGG